MHPELFPNYGTVAPARPWFPGAGCCESDHLRQITHRLMTSVIEHRPNGTMLVIWIAGRPQYIGKGSFVSSKSAAAWGREPPESGLETFMRSAATRNSAKSPAPPMPFGTFSAPNSGNRFRNAPPRTRQGSRATKASSELLVETVRYQKCSVLARSLLC